MPGGIRMTVQGLWIWLCHSRLERRQNVEDRDVNIVKSSNEARPGGCLVLHELAQLWMTVGIADPWPEDAFLCRDHDHQQIDVFQTAPRCDRFQGSNAELESEQDPWVTLIHPQTSVRCAQDRAPLRSVHHGGVSSTIWRECCDRRLEIPGEQDRRGGDSLAHVMGE